MSELPIPRCTVLLLVMGCALSNKIQQPNMRTRGLVDGADTDVAIPMMIDHYLDHGAGLTYAVFPGDSDGSPVVRVTYQEYARAVHRFAQTQREAPRDEVVAIIATCDTLVS